MIVRFRKKQKYKNQRKKEEDIYKPVEHYQEVTSDSEPSPRSCFIIAKITVINPAKITIGDMYREIKPSTSFSRYMAENPENIKSIATPMSL